MPLTDTGWVAANVDEARRVLSIWGRTAPPRLERRGRNKELEAWVMNRMLSALIEAGRLPTPVAVEDRGENPDFVLHHGRRVRGVEVTTACDPAEQAWRTDQARSGARVRRTFFDVSDKVGRESAIRTMIHRAIQMKAARAGERVTELLIYLATDADGWGWDGEDWPWRMALIRPLPQEAARFDRVWLLLGGEVGELHSGEVLGLRPAAKVPSDA